MFLRIIRIEWGSTEAKNSPQFLGVPPTQWEIVFSSLKPLFELISVTIYHERQWSVLYIYNNCAENLSYDGNYFKKTVRPSYRMSTERLHYMRRASWASFHIGISMSVVSSTSGRLPKKNWQIRYGERRPLGGNLGVNLTLYIWQPVAYLKNNLSWAVVSTSWNQAAGCRVSRELFAVYFTGRVSSSSFKCQSETALCKSLSRLPSLRVIDSIQGLIHQQSVQ